MSLRPVAGRLGARDLGLRLLPGGKGGVVLGLARGLLGEQRLQALGLLVGQHERRLLAGQRRLGAGEIDLVERGVDLVEDVAFLDLAALLEQPLHHEAGNPGADLGDAHRRDAAGQVPDVGDRLRRHSHDADLGRWPGHRRGGLLLLIAGGQGDEHGAGEDRDRVGQHGPCAAGWVHGGCHDHFAFGAHVA